MNRRDFLERFAYAISALLFALFGIRPDVSQESIRRAARGLRDSLAETSKRLYDRGIHPRHWFVNSTDYANIVREIHPWTRAFTNQQILDMFVTEAAHG